jgi:hypothetical protein
MIKLRDTGLIQKMMLRKKHTVANLYQHGFSLLCGSLGCWEVPWPEMCAVSNLQADFLELRELVGRKPSTPVVPGLVVACCRQSELKSKTSMPKSSGACAACSMTSSSNSVYPLSSLRGTVGRRPSTELESVSECSGCCCRRTESKNIDPCPKPFFSVDRSCADRIDGTDGAATIAPPCFRSVLPLQDDTCFVCMGRDEEGALAVGAKRSAASMTSRESSFRLSFSAITAYRFRESKNTFPIPASWICLRGFRVRLYMVLMGMLPSLLIQEVLNAWSGQVPDVWLLFADHELRCVGSSSIF